MWNLGESAVATLACPWRSTHRIPRKCVAETPQNYYPRTTDKSPYISNRDTTKKNWVFLQQWYYAVPLQAQNNISTPGSLTSHRRYDTHCVPNKTTRTSLDIILLAALASHLGISLPWALTKTLVFMLVCIMRAS